MLGNFHKKSYYRHLKFFYGKHDRYVRGVSRKTKKAMLGKRMGRSELKARISAVTVTVKKYPQAAELSDEFCPKCGCDYSKSTGNMAYYPEEWVRTYCLRCGYLVGEADNSPFVHVLELMCGPEKEEFDPKYWR
jgi:predicted nucleic-acid-binding Zn-ribbon protein